LTEHLIQKKGKYTRSKKLKKNRLQVKQMKLLVKKKQKTEEKLTDKVQFTFDELLSVLQIIRLLVYKMTERCQLFIKGLAAKASREGLLPSEVLSEWSFLGTREETNMKGTCVCGRKNLAYDD